MTVYKPMEWEIWTLTAMASLPCDPTKRSGMSAVLAAVEQHEPLPCPVLFLHWDPPEWVPFTSHDRMVAAVKALAWGLVRVGLDGDTRGQIVNDSQPEISAPSSFLVDAVLRGQEKRRLVEAGRGDLLEVMDHYAARWRDYRIPVWRKTG